MVNTQTLEGNWAGIKGQVQEKWGQISDNELQQVKGDANQLIGLIQRKTGEAREQIERQLDDFATKSAGMASRGVEAAKQLASNASEQAQQTYEQVSGKVQDGYHQAEAMVQQKPLESVAVAFGTGLIAGVVVGLVLRSR